MQGAHREDICGAFSLLLFSSQSLSATLLLHRPLYGDDGKAEEKGNVEISWDLDVYYFFIMKK